MTIEEFIEARLAEDEHAATMAFGAPWEAPLAPWIHVSAKAQADDKLRFGHLGYVGTIERDGDREHVLRHDPARVLRQCAAIQSLIKSLIDAIEDEMPGFERVSEERLVAELGPVASIWADHPAYRPEWSVA